MSFTNSERWQKGALAPFFIFPVRIFVWLNGVHLDLRIPEVSSLARRGEVAEWLKALVC